MQITTGQTCHLDAHMVHDALHALDLDAIDILFIENVGNLVCPAGFDLGQHANVTLLAATEGDDKPAKYPVMFRAADLVLLSKSDLLDVLDDFSPAKAEAPYPGPCQSGARDVAVCAPARNAGAVGRLARGATRGTHGRGTGGGVTHACRTRTGLAGAHSRASA